MIKHSSRIDLSQKALQKNVNFIRKKIGPKCTYSAVIKANAYGHGIPQMVKMLEKAGVHHFSVASAYEGWQALENKAPESRIMIMGILYDDNLEWAIENDIEIYVFHLDRLEKVKEIAEKMGKKAQVHIEVETGANRTGLHAKEFNKAITFIQKHRKHFEFEGLCSHFGGAESLANKFKIDQQLVKFKEFRAKLKKKKFEPNKYHISSSAAALSLPEARFDMVRVGVATYGFWPSPDMYYHHLQENGKNKDSALNRVFTWKTDVMDIRPVATGEFIGYGTAFQAVRPMVIAVIPLGYSNGYPRGLSNRGFVLIRGKRAPVVGLINMNLFMVDVTHIKDVQIDDEVVLIGRQKNNVINVSSFTNATQLLNNEMMSRLPDAIPRVPVR